LASLRARCPRETVRLLQCDGCFHIIPVLPLVGTIPVWATNRWRVTGDLTGECGKVSDFLLRKVFHGDA
jgi:hypothetical protein